MSRLLIKEVYIHFITRAIYLERVYMMLELFLKPGVEDFHLLN